MQRKGQLEIALIKGIALAILFIAGYLVFEEVTGHTQNGEEILCEWDCTDVDWSECQDDGFAYRDYGNCSEQETCKCIPNDGKCFSSTASPSLKKLC